MNEIATIQAGEFCGETGMHGHQAAEMRAVALEDTTVVVIAPDVVRHLFETSPRLARDTGHVLDVTARRCVRAHRRPAALATSTSIRPRFDQARRSSPALIVGAASRAHQVSLPHRSSQERRRLGTHEGWRFPPEFQT